MGILILLFGLLWLAVGIGNIVIGVGNIGDNETMIGINIIFNSLVFIVPALALCGIGESLRKKT